MDLVTRDILARAAPLRLAMQYRDRMDEPLWNGRLPQSLYDKLIVSDLQPATVDAIMGGTSWTQLYCNCCREFVERAVNVDMTGGEYSTHICEPCVKKMEALFHG